jgi:exo-beta-1,3-glucanase (GH17 family)
MDAAVLRRKLPIFAIALATASTGHGGVAPGRSFNSGTVGPPCVAYAPTHFDPTAPVPVFPSDTEIARDLAVLHDEGFRCLLTYASDGTLSHVPRLARQAGFTCVYMGIWCPTNAAEIRAAVAESSFVTGYVVGNEGLDEARACAYDTTALSATIAQVRAATGKLVTTSEQIDDYLTGRYADWLRAHGDRLFPNAHPYWAGITQPDSAAQWTLAKYEALAALTSKRISLKETGLPSAGCGGCSEERQRLFFQLLRSTPVEHCVFEAFDQPWKGPAEVEKHWGVNDANRRPKLVVPVGRMRWEDMKGRYR